jgi:hypothetical protein
MEPSYGVWADALSKFQSASEPIQALSILALAATVFGYRLVLDPLHPRYRLGDAGARGGAEQAAFRHHASV